MSFTPSYYPNYFSITDILASQERVPCSIEVVLPRLGYLDASSESQDLQPGTKLELPYWLASTMNVRRRTVLSIEVPKIYKEAYREILSADACAVELNKWSSFFYEFGILLSRFDLLDSEKIRRIMIQTFQSRIKLVMDLAQNTGTDPTVGSQLPIMEREMFVAGRKARSLLISWLKEGGGSIETSEMVANHKKRKRTELENDDT